MREMEGGGGQRPLELILARNLLASLCTPAFLIDHRGDVAFYNEAAGSALGRNYEDSGPMPAEEWVESHGPVDSNGEPVPFEELKLTQILRGNHPAHEQFNIRTQDGTLKEVEVSGLPIVGADGYQGAIVVFWPVDE